MSIAGLRWRDSFTGHLISFGFSDYDRIAAARKKLSEDFHGRQRAPPLRHIEDVRALQQAS